MRSEGLPLSGGVAAILHLAVILILACTAPAPSESMTLGVKDVTNNSVTVTWTVASGSAPQRFQVQRRVGRIGPWVSAVEDEEHRPVPASDYQREISNLEPGTDYCFRISATSPNEDTFSGTRCVTTHRTRELPASVELSVRVGPFKAATETCNGPLVWTFIPVRLRGSTGKETPFTVERNYEVAPRNTAPDEWYCFLDDNTAPTRLRRGRWQIRVQGPEWGTRCEVNLRVGLERANFTQHKQGCRQGNRYP